MNSATKYQMVDDSGDRPVVIFEQEMTLFGYWVEMTAPFLFGHVYQELHEELWYGLPEAEQA